MSTQRQVIEECLTKTLALTNPDIPAIAQELADQLELTDIDIKAEEEEQQTA